jgi:hypothetical protein
VENLGRRTTAPALRGSFALGTHVSCSSATDVERHGHVSVAKAFAAVKSNKARGIEQCLRGEAASHQSIGTYSIA